MKRWQYITTLGLSILCLIISISVVGLMQSTRTYQERLRIAQTEITRAREGNQVARLIIQDLVGIASTSGNVRTFLKRHGVVAPTQSEPSVLPAAKPASSGKRTTKSGKGK